MGRKVSVLTRITLWFRLWEKKNSKALCDSEAWENISIREHLGTGTVWVFIDILYRSYVSSYNHSTLRISLQNAYIHIVNNTALETSHRTNYMK